MPLAPIKRHQVTITVDPSERNRIPSRLTCVRFGRRQCTTVFAERDPPHDFQVWSFSATEPRSHMRAGELHDWIRARAAKCADPFRPLNKIANTDPATDSRGRPPIPSHVLHAQK